TAHKLQQYGYGEVNLNLGCPSKTVVAKGRGSGFLAFPDKLDAFLEEIFEHTDMKISIKTRIGKESPEEFERLLGIYNQYPLEELIIHPRVQMDFYKNTPNWV
ncbi:MAG TPA: diguanylate cyclase, partial [Lachnospiraceae bacterium]|nr:diguanylate cyclase [Lachnospiraceae bacterium]